MRVVSSSLSAAAANLSVVLEEIGEYGLRVQRNVPEHVVEDVRLRQIVELAPLSYRHRRRKLSQRQALKKAFGGDESRHRDGFPSGRRSKAAIDFRQVRHGFHA